MDNLMTDEIIKRRLLIDGDGVGDDRKLMGLIKGYVAWVRNVDVPTTSSSSSTSDSIRRSLLLQLQQVEQSEGRSYEAIKVNQHSSAIFLRLKDDVAAEIVQTKDQILLSKALLEEATKHRKYSMEYDALAKLIQSKPDRRRTDARRLTLQAQLHTLRSRQGSLDLKLEERKKALSMMSSTIERLKELLGDEDTEAEVPNFPVLSSILPAPTPLLPHHPQTALQQQTQLEGQEATTAGLLTSTTTPIMMMEVDESPSSPIPSTRREGDDDMEEEEVALEEVCSSAVCLEVNTPSPPHNLKTKSEKYEDLSESEGEQAE